MTNSLKIGIISGLVAGLIAGIVSTICNFRLVYLEILPPAPNVFQITIITNIIWGAIFGVIYSRAYEIIPGKNLSKGLIFGLIIALITNIRDATFWLPYGIFIISSLGWMLLGLIQSITYGFLIWILYKNLSIKYGVPKSKLKIKTYDIMSGIHIGAIVGLTDGIVSFISEILGSIVGLFPVTPIPIDPIPYVTVLGMRLIINMIWGIVLVSIYTQVYDLIPGKGILKGLYFGLLFFLVGSFRMAIYWFGWGDLASAWGTGLLGFLGSGIAFGLVLGLLYRKPTK
jgi:hypothetical protein